MHAPAGYRILEEIGRGGMGVVYRALQVDLKREVALKCLLPGLAAESEVMSRLRREAGAMSRVAHPGLVKLLDVGEDGGQPYLSMEIVPGASLAQLLKTDFQTLCPRADAIVDDLLEALAVLHGAGLTHRDIKPSNVMLRPDGRPVLMDLGLVKELGSDGTLLTQAGQLVGTPCYLAPEVMRGGPVSPLADMWALGCVYFELANGHRLWSSESLPVLCATIIEGTLPDLAAACPGLSPARLALLARLLSKDPAGRPKTAREAIALAKHSAITPRSVMRVPRGSGAIRGVTPAAGLERGPASSINPAPARRGLALAAGIAGLALVAFALRPRSPATWSEVPHASSAASPMTPSGASLAPPASSGAPGPIAGAGVSGVAVGANDDHRDLARGWDDRYDYYHRLLELGGKPAERAMRDIQLLASAPLASLTPEAGMRWLDLGRWLKDGVKLEALPASLRENGHDQFAQQMFWNTNSLFSPRQLAIILLCESPVDARGWLALGHVLSAEGEFAAAQRVYAYAIRRPLGDVNETEWPRYLIVALIRAAMREPDRLLERKWPEWVQRDDLERNAWECLLEGLESFDPPRLEAMLAAAEPVSPSADLYLAWSRAAQLAGPPGGARAVLLRGRKRLPASNSIQHALIEEAGCRGALEEARADVEPAQWRWRGQLFADLIAGERRPLAACPVPGGADYALRPLLDAELATRGLAVLPEISKYIEANQFARDVRVGSWALDALGSGLDHPVLKDLADRAMNAGLPSWLTWDLEGCLATDAGAPWMERILVQPSYTSTIAQPARRALWLARRGRYAEALDLLAKFPRAEARAWPTEYVIETLARPFYASAVGPAVAGTNTGVGWADAAVLERARAVARRLLAGDLVPRFIRPGVAFELERRYLDAVVAGRLQDAVAPARELAARQPQTTLWGESIAWAAWLARDDAAFARELERGRRACIFGGGSTWWLRRLRALKR